MTPAVALTVALTLVAPSALAQCHPPKHVVARNFIAPHGSIGNMEVRIDPADVSVDNLVCLARMLKRDHPEWTDVFIPIFDSLEAALAFQPGKELIDYSGGWRWWDDDRRVRAVYFLDRDPPREYRQLTPLGWEGESPSGHFGARIDFRTADDGSPRWAQFHRGSAPGIPGIASHDFAQQAVANDPEAHHNLVAAIAANLKRLYVDRAIGQHLADALLAHDKKGEYESIDTGADLAARLNKDIQTASRALGMPRGVFIADVVYSAPLLPIGPPPPMTAEMRERNRAALLQRHCLFETIETLPHNVGYLKLNGFADATSCQETTSRAMASVNNVDALIVDLRDNGGGFGDTALQIAGYLFDRPTYLYDPRPHSPVPAGTESPVSGNKLVDKPVYVLTSSRTQSAAEYFVYNMKMLKRATIVGETTAGHQHSGTFHRITDHFGMGIQEVAPPDNPFPVKGWEVIGIQPDVRVSRSEAFDAARKLAESQARRR